MRIVTLTTDFGTCGSFVGAMKGVILSLAPDARIVDITHEAPPFDIPAAALILEEAYGFFPPGTIHVAVVDPGVGSARRPLLVTTSRYFFVAPDNGLLSYIYQEEAGVEVRQIENKQYRLDSEGTTFDGRDLFAPAAAWLTRGQPPGSYGRLVRDYVTLPIHEPVWEGNSLVGRIVYVDHFGNLISNVTPLHLKEVQGKLKRGSLTIRVSGVLIEGLTNYYAEGSPNAPQALINSNGQLEVFVKEGSAAEWLKLGRGERIEVS